MSNQTIFIVSNAYPPNIIGGAEVIAHNQAKALQKAGHNVVVFAGETYSDRTQYTCYRDDFEGVCVYRIRLGADTFSEDGVNFFNEHVNRAFEKIVQAYQPDIVHIHNIIGVSLGIIDIAKANDSKVFITLHDHWGYCLKNTRLLPNGSLCNAVGNCTRCKPGLFEGVTIPIKFRQDYFAHILSKVDAFISPSQYLADCYIDAGFPKEKMNVIWNGIEVQRFQNIHQTESQKIRFTYVGYFGKHKGVIHILEALEKSKLKDKIQLNLVGGGEEIYAYQQFIKQHKLKDYVKFWGKLPNSEIQTAYEETDVYVMASIWPENQPVTITEAMICGKPVIASKLGGNVELVQDGYTGLLYDPFNVDELVEKMEWMIQHPEERIAYGKHGKAMMEQYTFDRQVDTIYKLYCRTQKTSEAHKNVVIAFEGRDVPLNVATHLQNEQTMLLEWLSAETELDILVLKADTAMPLTRVAEYMKRGVVIIAPEERKDIVQELTAHNCGLYYLKSQAVGNYIEYILWHYNLLSVLKRNAENYIKE